MIKVENLCVSYGGIEAVKNISFEVPDKSIVTLIGANGAGKSTTLQTIMGLVKPKSGTITFNGEVISGKTTETIVSKGITLVPEGRRVFPDLTVLENIKIGAYLRHDDLTGDIEWIYDLFPILKTTESQQEIYEIAECQKAHSCTSFRPVSSEVTGNVSRDISRKIP